MFFNCAPEWRGITPSITIALQSARYILGAIPLSHRQVYKAGSVITNRIKK